MIVECNCNPYATDDDLNCEKCPVYDTCLLVLPYDEELDKLDHQLRYYQRQVSESISYKNYMMDFIREFKDEGKNMHILSFFNHDLYDDIIVSQPVVGSGNIPFFMVWVKGFSYNLVYQETYSYHIKQVYSLNSIDAIVKGSKEYELLRKFILNTNILTDADDLLNLLIENIKTDCIIPPEKIQDGILQEILEEYNGKPLKEVLRILRNKRKQAVDTINNANIKIRELTEKINKKQHTLKKTLQKEALERYKEYKDKNKENKAIDNEKQGMKQDTKKTRKRKIYTKKKVKT